MQDIKRIQDNPDKFKLLLKNKNIDLDVDHILELNNQKHKFQIQLEGLRKQRNDNTDEIKNLKSKPPQELIDKGKKLKEEVATLENELKIIETNFNNLMKFTPQFVSDDTPIGKDESGNIEVKKWSFEDQQNGTPKQFSFQIKDHIELGEKLNIVNLSKGVQTGGFRSYYLKNEGALMHMGLMMYGLKLMKEKGFELFIPPTIVKEEVLFGSGHIPFDEENTYVVDSLKHTKEDDDIEGTNKKYLVGTSEPSLLYFNAEQTIDEEKLPLKLAGFSQCYRSEIGSYGRDTKGLYRVHEFMKIEQVVICKNDYASSEEWHQTMLTYSEKLLQDLKLPYRVLQMCTGDMGAGKYKMYDIETWMPSRGQYGETHSASNLGDWQTRRLNIRVKGKDGKKYFPHALNNTVIASPRILIALWENYQNEDGSITVPEILREYVGKERIANNEPT